MPRKGGGGGVPEGQEGSTADEETSTCKSLRVGVAFVGRQWGQRRMGPDHLGLETIGRVTSSRKALRGFTE